MLKLRIIVPLTPLTKMATTKMSNKLRDLAIFCNALVPFFKIFLVKSVFLT